MKYIKTPVQPGANGDITNTIYDADGNLLALNIGFSRNVGPTLNEIVQVVNAHDALVSERDALVGVCEGLDRLAVRFQSDETYTSDRFIMDIAEVCVKARKILAIVREKEEQ